MDLPTLATFLRLAAGFGLVAMAAARADAPGGKQSEWNGFRRLDFTVAGRTCLLVLPKAPAPGRPWIWRTEFFGHEPQADIALLGRGWAVGYMNAQDMYGSPQAMELFDRYYEDVTTRHGLGKRVVMEGFSRGGLYAFNYAVRHPDRVSALYLDAPALDIRSWPGRHKDSKEWRECLAAYGLTERTAAAFRGSPVDNAGPVARAGIPILCVCGDADESVPFAENTLVLEKRYRALGGKIEVIVKHGGHHHPHSLKDPTPIVDFILKNAR